MKDTRKRALTHARAHNYFRRSSLEESQTATTIEAPIICYSCYYYINNIAQLQNYASDTLIADIATPTRAYNCMVALVSTRNNDHIV